MKKVYRKQLLVVTAIILAIVSVLTACGSNDKTAATSEQEVLDLKIADIASNVVFRVALAKGIFEEHGIHAELVNFATPAEGINSLFIKQVDIAWGADFPILNAISKGEYSILASIGTDSDERAAQWKLYANKEVKSAADLKGKVLSTLRGTFIPYLWDEYLKESGIDLSEVELIGQGGFDESYVALKKGEIDAVWVTGAAMIAKFDELDNAHVLTDMSKTSVRLGSTIIAPDTLIKQHPDGLARFLQAIEEASEYAQAHPEETADILFKEVKQPKEATLKDLRFFSWTVSFDQIALDSLNKQKTYMVDNGIIEKDYALGDKLWLDAVKEVFPDRVFE